MKNPEPISIGCFGRLTSRISPCGKKGEVGGKEGGAENRCKCGRAIRGIYWGGVRVLRARERGRTGGGGSA